METLVGVIQFVSKYKFGRNKNHAEFFLFKPLTKNSISYLVASSKKEQTNQYAIITGAVTTTNSSEKLPIGHLVRLLGACNNPHSIYDAIIYKHGLTTIQSKFDISSFKKFRIADPIPETHRSIADHYVFSVDPPGCEDIDDALSVYCQSSSTVEVGIHIADVSYFFDTFQIQIKNYATIYAPHRSYDMIPHIFAANVCSLKPGELRYSFTVFIQLEKDTGNVLGFRFEKNVIRSARAYNYAELQQLIDEDHLSADSPERMLYDIAKKRYDAQNRYDVQNGYDAQNGYDTHKMIEIFMILANCTVGKYLYDNAPPHLNVFRIQPTMATSELAPPKEIANIIPIFQSEAAVYACGNSNNLYHSGLKVSHYVHFTSPIRRFADVYTHMLLNSILKKLPLPASINVDNLNLFDQRTKRTQREFTKLQLATNDRYADVYVIDVSDKTLYVYFLDCKLLHRIKLISKAFRSANGVNVLADEHGVTIHYFDRSVRIEKYSKIEVKIVSTPYNDDIHRKVLITVVAIDRLLCQDVKGLNTDNIAH